MTLTAFVLAWAAASGSTALWAFLRSHGRQSCAGCGACADCARRDVTPVLLLRPCAGDEPHLAEALASSRFAPAGSRVRVLVAAAADPAAAVGRRACDDLVAAGLDARVVVTGARAGNRKAAQLAAAIEAEPGAPSIVLVADSDVALTREVVAALTTPLAGGEVAGEAAAGGVAAVWAPPVETRPRTLGDRASASVLGASLHAFALLSTLDPRGMVGKAFTIRRQALDRVGGFSPLAALLGEDMELARRLRAAGLRVLVAACPALSLASGRSWRATAERYARWLLVLRAQRPLLLAAYPALLAAAPIQLVLALGGLARGEAHALLATALVLGLRPALAVLARLRSRLARRSGAGELLVGPWLADLTLLAALARALSTRTVRWRGVPLRVERGALLAEVER